MKKMVIVSIMLTAYAMCDSVSSPVNNGDGTFTVSVNGSVLRIKGGSADAIIDALRAGKSLVSSTTKRAKAARRKELNDAAKTQISKQLEKEFSN